MHPIESTYPTHIYSKIVYPANGAPYKLYTMWVPDLNLQIDKGGRVSVRNKPGMCSQATDYLYKVAKDIRDGKFSQNTEPTYKETRAECKRIQAEKTKHIKVPQDTINRIHSLVSSMPLVQEALKHQKTADMDPIAEARANKAQHLADEACLSVFDQVKQILKESRLFERQHPPV